MGYEKAVLIPEDGKKEIKVQFNPAEYNLSRSTTYAEKKVLGLDDPFTQYIAGEAETLKITLMFDTYMPPGEKNAEESGSDVRLQTEKIAKLMELDPKKHRPPKVTFRYGSLIFSGVITELNQTFTMFLANGMPVRAKLEVTFRSMGKENTHVPLESPDRTKCRTTIVAKEYRLRILSVIAGFPTPHVLFPVPVDSASGKEHFLFRGYFDACWAEMPILVRKLHGFVLLRQKSYYIYPHPSSLLRFPHSFSRYRLWIL